MEKYLTSTIRGGNIMAETTVRGGTGARWKNESCIPGTDWITCQKVNYQNTSSQRFRDFSADFVFKAHWSNWLYTLWGKYNSETVFPGYVHRKIVLPGRWPGGIRKPGVLSHSRRAGHLGRRLESVEAARDLVVLLVLPLLNALEALDAILRDVRTEFLAI